RKTIAIALLTGSILTSGTNGFVGAVNPEVPSALAQPTPQGGQTDNGPGRSLPGFVRALDTQHIGSGPLAYAPDGQTLATSGGPGQVRLWNPATGEQRGLLKINQELPPYVHALAFSPDGKTLAVGYASEKDKLAVRLWDVRTAQVTRALRVER